MPAAATSAKGRAFVSFWATGQGQTVPMGGYLCPVLPVTAAMGGVQTDVAFAAMIDPGVLQVNVRVPDAAPSGDAVSLVLHVGDATSRKVATLALRCPDRTDHLGEGAGPASGDSAPDLPPRRRVF